MINYRRRRGQAAKLQPKFVGPYAVVEVMPPVVGTQAQDS